MWLTTIAWRPKEGSIKIAEFLTIYFCFLVGFALVSAEFNILKQREIGVKTISESKWTNYYFSKCITTNKSNSWTTTLTTREHPVAGKFQIGSFGLLEKAFARIESEQAAHLHPHPKNDVSHFALAECGVYLKQSVTEPASTAGQPTSPTHILIINS